VDEFGNRLCNNEEGFAMKFATLSNRRYGVALGLVLGALNGPALWAATETDYEFMPLHAWRILGETGD
jgi:hypothetical protein